MAPHPTPIRLRTVEAEDVSDRVGREPLGMGRPEHRSEDLHEEVTEDRRVAKAPRHRSMRRLQVELVPHRYWAALPESKIIAPRNRIATSETAAPNRGQIYP